MIEIYIDPKKWLRGEGGGPSYLLRPTDGKMCCWGICSAQLGVPLAVLSGRKTIGGDFAELVVLGPGDGALRSALKDPYGNRLCVTYNVNDYGTDEVLASSIVPVTDEERVALLNKHVEPIGLRFVLRPVGGEVA